VELRPWGPDNIDLNLTPRDTKSTPAFAKDAARHLPPSIPAQQPSLSLGSQEATSSIMNGKYLNELEQLRRSDARYHAVLLASAAIVWMLFSLRCGAFPRT
jgi:hypothetical protein